MRSIPRLCVVAWILASAAACSDEGLLLGWRMDATEDGGAAPPRDVAIAPSSGGRGASYATTADAMVSVAGAGGAGDAGGAGGGILDLGDKICGAEGWCWFHPLPQGNTVTAVWANGPSDVWAVGPTGLVLRRDATKWTLLPSGTTRDLTAVWASGPDDAWAVGTWGTLIHWNGAVWSPVDRIYDDGGNLGAVWGSAPNDVWVGGSDVFHYDGRAWTKTTLDIGGASCIWGAGANDVWASGAAGMAHWDGASWTRVDSPLFPDAGASGVGVVVSRMWGSGPKDVWGAASSVIHWDGTAWSKVGSPGISANAGWGTGPNDAWVAGSNGFSGLLSHWDGTSWTEPAYLDPRPNNANVNALWGFASNDVWLMGDDGVTAHNDGTGWTLATRSVIAVSGIWGSAADDVWAVGAGGALHWDGRTLTETALGTSFTGISGLAANDIWASTHTAVAHWDGVSWSPSPGSGWMGASNGNGTYPTVNVTSVWATSPNDVWAVGVQGLIEHFDGAQWQRYPLDGRDAGDAVFQDLQGVWASGPNDAWVTGDEVAHWDGAAWTKWPDQGPSSGSGGQLYGSSIWGSARDDVWMANGWENLRHFDGTSWSTSSIGAPGGIQRVWGRGRNDVWASGGWISGTVVTPFVMHYDGSTWSQSNVGVAPFQLAGWTSPAGDVWIGNVGLLHHDPFPGTASDGGAPPPLSQCSGGGWCWQHPLPQGNALHALNASAANNVWAVGDDGTALRYDGRAWSSHPLASSIPSTPFRLNGVWTTDPLATWAVGSRGVVAFWDGSAWHFETGASGGLDSLDSTLTGVWASSPTDIWVVGYDPGDDGGTVPLLARSRNGGPNQLPIDSAPQSIATTGIGTDALFGIWGSGPSDVWVCGNGGAWHWDGGAWTFGTGSNVGRLLAMWGAGPGDVWAVGMGGKTIHWTGSSWSDVSSAASIAGVDVSSVWGTGPKDVWAGTVEGTVMHWTGSGWSPLSQLPNVAPTPLAAAAIGGTSASDLWLVGDGGMIQHFNGSTWSDSSTDRQGLTGLWGSGPNDVWAVGGGGFASETLHWDGASWTSIPNNTAWSIEGVWGRASNDVYAVGVGGVLQWTGSSWSQRTEPGALHYAGWGSSAGDFWAVGSGGKYSRYDGKAWTTGTITVDGGATGDLRGIWGSASNDVWAVGDPGILHWNGGAWSLAKSGQAWAIWGNGPNDVWAVAGGSGNTDGSWHWDGTSWSTYGVTTPGRLLAVGGRASNDVWASGEKGAIVHWDGRVWTQSESGTVNALTSVWSAPSPSRGTWIAGEDGTILYRP